VGDFIHSPDHASALLDYFRREIDRAIHAGVHAIWIDPGLGFYYRNLQDSAARIRYQAETFLHSFRLRTLGWPVCHALPHAFEFFQDEVRSAESLFAVLAILGKTDLLRTHEIPKVRAVARTLGILSWSAPPSQSPLSLAHPKVWEPTLPKKLRNWAMLSFSIIAAEPLQRTASPATSLPPVSLPLSFVPTYPNPPKSPECFNKSVANSVASIFW
jgi:hypothetical protein